MSDFEKAAPAVVSGFFEAMLAVGTLADRMNRSGMVGSGVRSLNADEVWDLAHS